MKHIAEIADEGVVEERFGFWPWQFPKRTWNIFAATLQTLIMDVSFCFWWVIGNEYASYSKRRHDHDWPVQHPTPGCALQHVYKPVLHKLF